MLHDFKGHQAEPLHWGGLMAFFVFMPKRFTDTEKWRDEWWGSLPNDYRMIWLYLVDSCSIAGIWKKDFRGLNFNCNTNISEKEFCEVFGSRLIDRGNYFFIPKFVRFQYPKGLSSNKPAVISIVKELRENDLLSIVNELFGNDYLIIKDKDKDKDKGKDKGKDKPKKFSDDYYQTSEEIFEDLKNEYYLEPILLAIKGRGFKACDSVDVLACLKDWILTESPSGELFQKQKKDVRSHFSYWIRKQKPETIAEIGKRFKSALV